MVSVGCSRPSGARFSWPAFRPQRCIACEWFDDVDLGSGLPMYCRDCLLLPSRGVVDSGPADQDGGNGTGSLQHSCRPVQGNISLHVKPYRLELGQLCWVRERLHVGQFGILTALTVSSGLVRQRCQLFTLVSRYRSLQVAPLLGWTYCSSKASVHGSLQPHMLMPSQRL